MTDFTALEILSRARELISDPDHWIKGTFARKLVAKRRFLGLKKAKYAPRSVSDPDADCFCLMGALDRAASTLIEGRQPYYSNQGGSYRALSVLKIPTGNGWDVEHPSDQLVYRFNDSATHAEVLSVLDKAIERMEAQQ